MSYGIENGQVYRAADGVSGSVKVIDCETYADVDDVVVENEHGIQYRIDAFKLAMVRYYLVNQANIERAKEIKDFLNQLRSS
jgi:hypothetical protein